MSKDPEELATKIASLACTPSDLIRLRKIAQDDFEKVPFVIRAEHAENERMVAILMRAWEPGA